MKSKTLLLNAVGLGLVFALIASVALAQGVSSGSVRTPAAPLGTAFTYQGQLNSAGTPYTGACDMQFGLWDDATAGAQIGVTQTVSSLSVSNGLFTTLLDFGAGAFNGSARWLAIGVRCPAGSGGYTALAPRQALTPAPYAVYASAAPWSGLSGIPAGFADGTDNDTTYTAGVGLELNGTQFKMKGTSYQNVIIVAKSGGDYATIGAALAGITTNSATNRYLIWIAPGTYTETITLKEYVDIEGAGELATRITSAGSASDNTGTVVGANNAELRFLTVENTGNASFAIAVYNSSAAPRLTHLTINASGASANTYGVYNTSASPTMAQMTIGARGGSAATGVLNSNSSSPAMTDLSIIASAATYNYGVRNYVTSSPVMMNITVTATSVGATYNYGVRNETSSAPTMINVIANVFGGGENNGVYNASSSPSLMNVSVTASGGTNSNRGVYNYTSASPLLTNVSITASGGTNNYGVYNYSNSAPTLTNVLVSASGGTNDYGMYNNTSPGAIQNSTISASGGSNNYGLYHFASSGSYTVTVNNSQITGSTYTVRNDAEFTTRIGASKLDGGAVTANGGTVTCAFVYDETYTGYASTCP